jgi:hypothetical protein
MAMLGVLSMMALAMYDAAIGVMVNLLELTTAAQLDIAVEESPVALSLALPHLFVFLCVIPQGVALLRAKVIPVWALISLLVATATMLVLGSSLWSSTIWTILLVAGFAPAAAAMLRGPAQRRSSIVSVPGATSPVP